MSGTDEMGSIIGSGILLAVAIIGGSALMVAVVVAAMRALDGWLNSPHHTGYAQKRPNGGYPVFPDEDTPTADGEPRIVADVPTAYLVRLTLPSTALGLPSPAEVAAMELAAWQASRRSGGDVQ